MKKRLYLECIKIFACLMVLVNHINNVFTSHTPSSFTWYISIAYFLFSKPAVPLFLMCSGAVLLGKKDNYKTLYKRVIRIIIVLFVTSILYHISDKNVVFSFQNLINFILSIPQKRAIAAFWYLYLYIGILVMLPLLQKLIANLKVKDYYYLIFISVILMGILPILYHYWPKLELYEYLTVPILSTYVGIFIAGYFIDAIITPTKKLTVVAFLLVILVLIAQVIGTYFEYKLNGKSYLFYDDCTLLTTTLPSICIFYIAKNLEHKDIYIPDSLSKIISVLGSCTFGIFLLGDLLTEKMHFLLKNIEMYSHPLIAILINPIIVFFTGFLITYLLKRIVIIRNYI